MLDYRPIASRMNNPIRKEEISHSNPSNNESRTIESNSTALCALSPEIDYQLTLTIVPLTVYDGEMAFALSVCCTSAVDQRVWMDRQWRWRMQDVDALHSVLPNIEFISRYVTGEQEWE